jgi:ABC-type glycerol-3-phosphate transport system permease component
MRSTPPRASRWRLVRYHWPIYWFVLPTVVLVGLFQYYPAGSGVFHSFYRWNGADIAEFVGLGNYRQLLANNDFWQSFKVALILGICNVVKMIPALAVAVCIHRCRSPRMQFIYRLLFVVPMVIPGLVVALIWRYLFFEPASGYLNKLVHLFAPNQNPAWLGDPKLILIALIVWGFPWVGSFAVLTHLAKLQNISRDIYEAAEIDGVTWLSKFSRIELPLIGGSIYLLLVFAILDTIKDAGIVLALTGFEGGPGGVVTVPALFMIRKAFIEQQMGYACAIGILLTIVVLVLQKVSLMVIEWDRVSTRIKGVVKLVGMVVVQVILLRSVWRAVALAAIPLVGAQSAKPQAAEMMLDRSAARRARRARRVKGDLRTRIESFLLRASRHAFIWFVLFFAFLPLYLMLIVSFKDNTQFYERPAAITSPVHGENWRTAWQVVTPTVANSIFVSTSATALTLAFAIGAAYFFVRLRMPFSGILWNAILVMMMMPAVANLVPLFRLLRDLNLLNTLSALILVGASGGQMFAIFVLRNFVADIPRDLFEAAEIDGASHFQQLRVVVIPLAGPILGTVGVMQFIYVWNDFVLPLIIIRDADHLPVMVQLLRMSGEYVKLWGPLMAGYAIASVPIIVLFAFSMKLFVRGLSEGAVKG